MTRIGLRAGRFAGGLATVLALTCALSACGGADDPSTGPGDQAGGAVEGTTTSGNVLEVSVTDTGTTTTWTLICDPASGTHPDPAAACAALEKHPDALDPVASDAVCTMQYAGDETATLRGSWQGETVDATFSLKDGCEISRWTSLVPLLPLGAAGGLNRLTG